MSSEADTILDINAVPGNLESKIWYHLKLNGEHPSSRVGHTALYLEDCRKVLIFGGATPAALYNDLWQLNLWNLNVKRLEMSESFDSRYEHCVYNMTQQRGDSDRKLWLFGGATKMENKNDLWEYNIEKSVWRRLNQKGSIPSPRTFHTTGAVLGGKLTVFGGGDQGSKAVEDTQVYQLDPETITWTVLSTTGTLPETRQGHVLIAVGDRLFCHGGMSGTSMFDDLFILDVEGSWSNPDCSEIRPCGRAAHGAVTHDRYLYVFGGLGVQGSLNDLWRLDTDSFQWEEIHTTGAIPPPRLDFACAVIELPTVFPKPLENEDENHTNFVSKVNGHASAEELNGTNASVVPYLLIHGGMNTVGEILGDFYVTRLI